MADKKNARRSTKLLSLIISVCLVSACYIKQKTAEEVSDELNSLIYPGQRNSKYEIDYTNSIIILPEYTDIENRFLDYTYLSKKSLLKNKLTGKEIKSFEATLEISKKDYSISIEDFAKMVNKYIKSKGNNHHVVFCVDEVGQYIGENTDLMLNLQTVTEDLGVQCKGKAWVVVTSQQAIDSITKVKGNDFSKIQGRFKTRINLTSTDVSEVIKKRILDKYP